MSENPNAFKHWFDERLVREMGARVAQCGPFDERAFVDQCLGTLGSLELKDRVRLIAAALRDHLPADYATAVRQICDALPPARTTTDEVTSGIGIWPLCHFVESYGLDDLDVSMDAMLELTQRFSAEFAVRPYLLRYPDEVLARLAGWTTHDNPHVRRWVSEGTRPRLPWGIRLQPFIDDPSPILPLLEALRRDSQEYVRRSVANNLNDIAKDHPELVVATCRRWAADADADGLRMIKHALRTLVKAGHPGALELLGFGRASVELESFEIISPVVEVGGRVEFALRLRSTASRPQTLLIDYAVHHVKANGTTSAKVFKWTTREIPASQRLELTRHHSMKKVSTRTYYPGQHAVEVIVNGESLVQAAFQLTSAENT